MLYFIFISSLFQFKGNFQEKKKKSEALKAKEEELVHTGKTGKAVPLPQSLCLIHKSL